MSTLLKESVSKQPKWWSKLPSKGGFQIHVINIVSKSCVEFLDPYEQMFQDFIKVFWYIYYHVLKVAGANCTKPSFLGWKITKWTYKTVVHIQKGKCGCVCSSPTSVSMFDLPNVIQKILVGFVNKYSEKYTKVDLHCSSFKGKLS